MTTTRGVRCGACGEYGTDCRCCDECGRQEGDCDCGSVDYPPGSADLMDEAERVGLVAMPSHHAHPYRASGGAVGSPCAACGCPDYHPCHRDDA